jgi:hypothetical protein
MLIAALGDDKNAHNLTCDEIDRRTRGCTICMGELAAEQAMFTADLFNTLFAARERSLDDVVDVIEKQLAGLLDAGRGPNA